VIYKGILILDFNGFLLILLAVYLILLGLDVSFAYKIVRGNKEKMREKRDWLLITGIFILALVLFKIYKAIKVVP